MPKSTNNSSEWRSGRPSFKAFYPEVFILTVLTLVIVVFACRLSCKVVKNAKEAAVPESVSVDSLFLTSFAFAQDDSIDSVAVEAPATDENVAEDSTAEAPADAQPVEQAPAEQDATSEPAQAEETSPADASEPEVPADATSPDATPAEEENVAEPAQTDESNADPASSASTPVATAKKPVKGKLLGIWIPSVVIILVLWGWRGWKWIVAVFGTEYELRVDEDNPRAATFLIKRGIFNKTTDSMHIGAVKDVQSSQTIWQKYLKGGVGTIKLLTKDLTDGVVVMDNMAEPSRVFNAFDTLRKHYWARGGMTLNGGGDDLNDADGGFNQSDAEA